MEEKEVRWKQRFANYQRALEQLEEFMMHGELNKFEEHGLFY